MTMLPLVIANCPDRMSLPTLLDKSTPLWISQITGSC